jgi:hypothetical protein
MSWPPESITPSSVAFAPISGPADDSARKKIVCVRNGGLAESACIPEAAYFLEFKVELCGL